MTPNHYIIKVIPRKGKVSLTHLGGLCVKNRFPRMTGRDTPDTHFSHLPHPPGSFNITLVPTGEVSSQQAWRGHKPLEEHRAHLRHCPIFLPAVLLPPPGLPLLICGKDFEKFNSYHVLCISNHLNEKEVIKFQG